MIHTYNRFKNTKQPGFTIVELLIVIVVIAILAAISIVAYTSIQERAHATRVATTFNNYVKILTLHKVEYGHYPETIDSGWVCLGEATNYPVGAGLQTGECGDDTDDGIYSTDTSVTSALRSVVGSSLPDASHPPVQDQYGTIRGLLYGHWGDRIAIASYVSGDNDCPQGDPDEREYYSEYNITRCLVEIYE